MKTRALVISAIRMAASVEPTTVPTPPRMLTPADHRGGDDRELEAGRRGRLDDAELRGVDEGRDAGEEAMDGEHHDDGALRIDAAEARRLGVAAGGVDRPAAWRIAHPERRERGREHHDQDRHRHAEELRSARWKLCGRSVIHLPPVTLIRPPLRIDSIPSVTTIAGMRR